MLGKALTTAVLLAAALAAAPQAQAGSAFSTTIVIGSIPTIRIAHQGGYSRHWHPRPPHHPRAFDRHQHHHFARHHQPRHHVAPAWRYWAGHHHPRRYMAHRHGNPGRH